MLPVSPIRLRQRPLRSTFRSADVEEDLRALMNDPLFWRDRDPEFVAHVDRQFRRVFGDAPAARDATGRAAPGRPLRDDLEPFRPGIRPGDEGLSGSAGRDGRNDPRDVVRA